MSLGRAEPPEIKRSRGIYLFSISGGCRLQLGNGGVGGVLSASLASASVASPAARRQCAPEASAHGGSLRLVWRGGAQPCRCHSARAARMQLARIAVRAPRLWSAVLCDPGPCAHADVMCHRVSAAPSPHSGVWRGAISKGFARSEGRCRKSRACGAAPKW